MSYGLAFYPKDKYETPLSWDDATNPLRMSFDGLLGGSIVKRIFLHNDDSSVYYTNITVSFVDATGLYTVGDWSWKLISSIHEPVPEEWIETSEQNTLSLSDIGSSVSSDVSSFVSVWVRCSIPAGLLAQNVTGLVLRISCDKNLVTGV